VLCEQRTTFWPRRCPLTLRIAFSDKDFLLPLLPRLPRGFRNNLSFALSSESSPRCVRSLRGGDSLREAFPTPSSSFFLGPKRAHFIPPLPPSFPRRKGELRVERKTGAERCSRPPPASSFVSTAWLLVKGRLLLHGKCRIRFQMVFPAPREALIKSRVIDVKGRRCAGVSSGQGRFFDLPGARRKKEVGDGRASLAFSPRTNLASEPHASRASASFAKSPMELEGKEIDGQV